MGDRERRTGLSRRSLLAAGVALTAGVKQVADASAAPPPGGSGEISLTDFGAAGDGVADDAPALQVALQALAAAGGGILRLPAGIFRLASPVSQDFLDKASNIRIAGCGSASQILIDVGEAGDAIRLANAYDLVVESIVFVGVPGRLTDARRSLDIASCWSITLRDCSFYGVGSGVTDGAVVYAESSNLRLHGCQFRGCTGLSGREVSVVRAVDWLGLEVVDTDFLDWGVLNGAYHSKTPLASAFAWIDVGDADRIVGAFDQHVIDIRQCRFDEGCFRAIEIRPNDATSARAMHVRIDGVRIAGTAIDTGIGILVRFATNVAISRTWVGYQAGASTRDGIRIQTCVNVTLEQVTCVDAFSRITVTGTQKLLLLACQYGSLVSSASQTAVDTAKVSADGDVIGLPRGRGVRLTSPDGLTSRRLRLDNNGDLRLDDLP